MAVLIVQAGLVPVLGSDWLQVVVAYRAPENLQQLSISTLTEPPGAVPSGTVYAPVVWRPWVRWVGRTPRPF